MEEKVYMRAQNPETKEVFFYEVREHPATNHVTGLQPKLEEVDREDRQSGASAERKPRLSEQDEQESKFPVLDGRICANGWKGFSGLQTRKCGAGLKNPGNDCFLNAVLQALVHTPSLATFIVQRHKIECTSNSEDCLMCALRDHCVRVFLNDCPQSSTWMYGYLKNIFPRHQIGQQEDAHEMLTLLLDALDFSVAEASEGHQQKSGRKWRRPVDANSTNLRRVRCKECETVHTNYERIGELNLGLGIRICQNRLPTSVSELVAEFFAQEEIGQFSCENCKREVAAIRTTTVLRAPSVLIIHPKRFDSTGRKNKLHVNAEEYLDLHGYLFDNTDASYRLYGVIEHQGRSRSAGHYVAALRSFDERTWYHLNDAQRMEASLKRAQFMQPYILFYERLQSKSSD
ncbi:ubiquitin carboxyl-terminal hydrolase [Aphelenchoides avenae]|nr:ubiquitin carboxyl-terminal hydrolase [Aphelenchus avenae]